MDTLPELRDSKRCVSETRNGHVRSLLEEDEIDRARKEPGEIVDINNDSQNKLEKSNEHDTFVFTGKFSNATLRLHQEGYEATSVLQHTLCSVKKTQARKSSPCYL
ncbi:hypothetical protein TNCV_5048411 [Trichonephila clavipes]|nr:hypothetical protein TNCV_5048411 [Trichonephila clavipes]